MTPMMAASAVAALPGGATQAETLRLMTWGGYAPDAVVAGFFNSLFVASCVTALSLTVAITTAHPFERHDFRFKEFAYLLMLAPLVIPA